MEAKLLYPTFEDLCVDTHTRSADWCYGSEEISAYIGNTRHDFESQGIPVVKVHNRHQGKWPFVLVARKSLLDAWKKEHQPAPTSNGTKPMMIDQKTGLAMATVQDIHELKIAMSELTLAVKGLRSEIGEHIRAMIALRNEIAK